VDDTTRPSAADETALGPGSLIQPGDLPADTLTIRHGDGPPLVTLNLATGEMIFGPG
jgi:hypothetical protein